jgi:hypothetical protein
MLKRTGFLAPAAAGQRVKKGTTFNGVPNSAARSYSHGRPNFGFRGDGNAVIDGFLTLFKAKLLKN